MTATPASRRALIAIADPWLRSALAASLRRAGIDGHCARDGYGSWAVLLEARGEIPLVVTDSRLPGLSGVGLIRRLRSVRPDLRAILLAGELSDAQRGALAAEDVATARLPMPLAQLARHIEALLGSPPQARQERLQAVG